jgi:NAD(P)-dependent dehydrogenase (short-subunit alcohol dehydrogenase family)
VTGTGARSFAPDVRVNSVLPGPHDTEDLELFLTELVDADVFDDLDSAWSELLRDSPYETPGDPLDLGKLVAFLSSEHASFVNGAAVPVDGGARI